MERRTALNIYTYIYVYIYIYIYIIIYNYSENPEQTRKLASLAIMHNGREIELGGSSRGLS